MANSKRKPKDTDCKNWLDRKQSNKKERQAGLQYVREVKLKVGALKIDRTIPKIYVDEH